jgi:hypothetical protein
MLGQQVAESSSRLDSPGTWPEQFSPGQQLGSLLARRSHSNLA